jgi:hypothetical protein
LTEPTLEIQFSSQVDDLLRQPGGELTAREESAGLALARGLLALDLSAESSARQSLRATLAAHSRFQQSGRVYQQTLNPAARLQPQPAQRSLWLGLAVGLVVILALAFTNERLVSAVQHMLGYGYLPEVGFFQLNGTNLIKGPVTQAKDGQLATVLQGMSGPDHTTLWLNTNFNLPPAGDLHIELPDGSQVSAAVLLPGSGGETQVIFSAVLQPNAVSVLAWPGGWRLPLEWVAAAQAGLAPTQVSVPSPAGSSGPTPCFTVDGLLRICVQAAFADAQGTRLRLETIPLQTGAVLDRSTPLPASLTDENGRSYPLTGSACSDAACSLVDLQFGPTSPALTTFNLRFASLGLKVDGSKVSLPGPYDLGLRLPERVPLRSPTPRAVETTPRIESPEPGVGGR